MTAETAICGILGENIDYTLSPNIFRTLFARHNVDAMYNRFDVGPALLKNFVSAARTLPISAFNVTTPYKETIFAVVDHSDEICRATGSVNLVVNARGKLQGYNTDYAGIAATIEEKLRCTVRDADVTLVGSGGAARTVYYYLVKNRAASVRVVHRSATRRKSFSQWAVKLTGKTNYVSASFAQLPKQHTESDLLINCTPVPIAELVSREQLESTVRVFELRYAGEPQTRRRHVTGEYMLAVQAAENFRIITGIHVSAEEIMKIIRKARG